MNPTQALHLFLAQERLELAGWRFNPNPPREGHRLRWIIYVRHVTLPLDAEFTGPQKHDALAQALHYAMMVDGAENAKTLPAPAMEAEHAAE
jgi:hypothetical protein